MNAPNAVPVAVQTIHYRPRISGKAPTPPAAGASGGMRGTSVLIGRNREPDEWAARLAPLRARVRAQSMERAGARAPSTRDLADAEADARARSNAFAIPRRGELYAGDGCHVAPSCLSCARVRCVHDAPSRPGKPAGFHALERRVARLYAGGWTVDAIAADVRRARRTVYRLLAGQGIERTACRPLTAPLYARILRALGLPRHHVNAKLGINVRAAKFRPHNETSGETLRAILDPAHAHLSTHQLAKIVGVSAATVCRHRKRARAA